MPDDAAENLRDAAKRLSEMAETLRPGDLSREALDEVIADLRITAVRRFGPRTAARNGDGGKGKILAYLVANLGQWVHGEELAAVSGIGEWARRTREWRTQEGYDIDEDAGSYRLNSVMPDTDTAEAWRVPNEIRRRPGKRSNPSPRLAEGI